MERRARRAFKREALPDYAAKSREGRTYQLDRVLAILDPMTPVEHVTTDRVVELYDALRRDRSHRTAMAYLDAISKVFQWAELENPVTLARTRITRKTPQTANARALNDANCNPVEPKAMAKLWPRLSGDLETVALLCHDAGLRIGEAMGLRWEDVTFGQDETDTRRAIVVKRSRVNGRTGKTKSGRERTVLLSRRLRAHLLAKRMASGRKARGYIVEHSWPKTYHDQMGRACLAAKVPTIRFKDLRDTFASVLITNGIVLHWVSRQLGHASLTVTEKHYARYMALDGYRNPWMVPEGEVPSDLFAALEAGRTKSAQIRTKVSK
ncbi:MAG: site-specific integrase [Planctomycetota bacterium]